MSDELESLGALGTAGLAAAALEGSKDGSGHAHGAAHTDAHSACANCKAPLTGPFCVMCGQSAHIHRSLLHLVEEVLHGILHFDAKAWRTIPLLVFFPGRLTRRYIDGQRKNYVSPLALFLFMIFLSFFMASFNGDKPSKADTPAQRQAKTVDYTKGIEVAKLAVTEATTELEAARAKGGDVSDQQENLDDARNDLKEAEDGLKKLMATPPLPAAPAAPAAATSTAVAPPNPETEKPIVIAGNMPTEDGISLAQKLANKYKGKEGFHSSIPALDTAIKHALDNPDLALYKLKNTTYKFSFMLVPISLPFLWLMFFWRRGVVMFDHAVFVLYSLCFMSLLFITLVLLSIVDWTVPIPFLAIFAPPIHMFVQLRGTYGLGKFSAFWRTCVLLCVAAIVLVVFMLFVLMMSMH
jgi:hypothetical protein